MIEALKNILFKTNITFDRVMGSLVDFLVCLLRGHFLIIQLRWVLADNSESDAHERSRSVDLSERSECFGSSDRTNRLNTFGGLVKSRDFEHTALHYAESWWWGE